MKKNKKNVKESTGYYRIKSEIFEKGYKLLEVEAVVKTKKNLFILLMLFMFAGTLMAQQGSEYINLNVRDKDIGDVLQNIVRLTGANIITHKSVKGKVNLVLRDIYYEKAIELICKTNGYEYRLIGNTYVIADPKALAEGFDVGLNKTFTMNFAKAEDIAKTISDVFKGKASKVDVSVDKRINAVIVSGTAQALDQVGKLIKTLDVAVHQVMIEAKIIEVNSTGSKKIGFDWDWEGGAAPSGDVGGGKLFQFGEHLAPLQNSQAYSPTVPDGEGGPLFQLGDFYRKRYFFDATFKALETSNDAKVLSNPKISALNGEQAKLIIGQKVIYGQTSDSPPQEKDVGVNLTVTPQVNENGYITVELEPELSFVSGYTSGTPQIDQRKAKTTVRVKDGEEILIGGLISENDAQSGNDIPILSKIPLIRSLFSSKSRNKTNNELIILITPHIMKRSEMDEAEDSVTLE